MVAKSLPGERRVSAPAYDPGHLAMGSYVLLRYSKVLELTGGPVGATELGGWGVATGSLISRSRGGASPSPAAVILGELAAGMLGRVVGASGGSSGAAFLPVSFALVDLVRVIRNFA